MGTTVHENSDPPKSNSLFRTVLLERDKIHRFKGKSPKIFWSPDPTTSGKGDIPSHTTSPRLRPLALDPLAIKTWRRPWSVMEDY